MDQTSGESTDLDVRSLEAILDNMDALVYVSDVETFELIYMNAYGRKVWGDPAGRKCWEVLQNGQGGPCEFCNTPDLLDCGGQPSGVEVWEFQNTVDGRWYQCRDQIIEWTDGRLVRLEIATDISDRKQMETELEEARAKALELACRDELTGLNNRREFFRLGEILFSQARRAEQPLAVLMFDMDRFKEINDAHGHAAGDETLRSVSERIKPLLRESDVAARIGGEEFAIILPNTLAKEAFQLCRRLREALSQLAVRIGDELLVVTASFGVAVSEQGEGDIDQLLRSADDAMYQAKRNGRDRVEGHGFCLSPESAH